MTPLTTKHFVIALAVAALIGAADAFSKTGPEFDTTVGISKTMEDVVLAAPKLEVIPLDDPRVDAEEGEAPDATAEPVDNAEDKATDDDPTPADESDTAPESTATEKTSAEKEDDPLEKPDPPFIVRIVDVSPHGKQFRYTFEYYALEAGEYNLMDYLQPADNAEAIERDPIVVHVGQYLEKLEHPIDPEAGLLPALGGYRPLMVLAALVWFGIAVAILYVGRKPEKKLSVVDAKPLTLADRIRPQVEAAIRGDLSNHEIAELERLLVEVWRKRLGLRDMPIAEAVSTLRKHPEAGPLFLQLERWLYQPGPNADVDVAELLAPYRNMPADAAAAREGELVAV